MICKSNFWRSFPTELWTIDLKNERVYGARQLLTANESWRSLVHRCTTTVNLKHSPFGEKSPYQAPWDFLREQHQIIQQHNVSSLMKGNRRKNQGSRQPFWVFPLTLQFTLNFLRLIFPQNFGFISWELGCFSYITQSPFSAAFWFKECLNRYTNPRYGSKTSSYFRHIPSETVIYN